MIEEYVTGAIFAAAPTTEIPSLVPETVEPDPQIQERLNDLAAEYAHGRITRAEWVSARDAIQSTANPTPTPTPTAPTSEITESRWKQWSPTERHQAAAWLLRSVLIAPSTRGYRGPLDTRVQFDWRR